MSRKYMDFVPAKKTVKLPEAAPVQRRRVMRRSSVGTVKHTEVEVGLKSNPEVAVKQTVVRRTVTNKVVARQPQLSSSSEAMSLSKSTKLGQIEDVNPKFVMTDVPKRPLSETRDAASGVELVGAAKAKRLVGRMNPLKATRQYAETRPNSTTVITAEQKVDATYQAPKSPFINQDKIVKRPLSSKNVYTKRVASESTLATSQAKPVTIITKPEKESHVGMVVTIILTIIFGAVAGTVAFLLLPK